MPTLRRLCRLDLCRSGRGRVKESKQVRKKNGKLGFTIRKYKAPALCFHRSAFQCLPINRQCGRKGVGVGIGVTELWDRIIYVYCREL